MLLDHEVNVEDSQMAILRGRFTMALIVAVSEATDVARLRSELDVAAAELELDALTVHEVAEVPAATAEPTHLVTIYGADHPGIVHAAAAALADAGCNITDLNTRLAGEGDGDLYVLLLEAAVPGAPPPRWSQRSTPSAAPSSWRSACASSSRTPCDVAVREVLLFPHPALKLVAPPVAGRREEAERVARDLLDTMAANPGCVGLAAPQLDELVRAVVVDVSEHPKAKTSNGLLVLVRSGRDRGRRGRRWRARAA